jgi:hypothetical protein
MSPMIRTSRVAVALLLSSSPLAAQAAATPFGHWQGSIKTPNQEIGIELDLGRSASGDLAATFSNPAQHVRGLPLTDVVVQGATVHFVLRSNAGGTFDGALSADGMSMAGKFVTNQGGYVVPFSVTRTGDAKIEPPPRSAAIGKELEGTWNAAVDVEGKSMQLVLTLANQPDGTSTGTLLSKNSGAEIPVAIVQQGASVTIDIRVTGASLAATLNADRTELAGTYTQGSFTMPMTFRRTSAGSK